MRGTAAHPAGVTRLGGQGGAPWFSMAGRAHRGVRVRRKVHQLFLWASWGSPVRFLPPFLPSVPLEPFRQRKLVLEVAAPAGAGRGQLDLAVATGQQVFPVLITMEVIRASARPEHACVWSQQQQLDKHQPELQKQHQPECELRPKREEEGRGCSVCICIYFI